MKLSLPPDWNLPEQLVKRLGDAAGRQRAMTADGHLLLVLHEPPLSGAAQRAGRLFWRNPEGTWRAKPLGDGPQALKRHTGEFADRVEELEERWHVATTAEEYFSLVRTIAPLHRTARNLHATLQQAREMAPEDRDLINARDQIGEIERTLELLHADARNGLDFTVAHQSEQQAARSHDMAVAAYRLNLLAAAFFPVATLSAIFSMNLSHGLEGMGGPVPFWGLLGLGLASGLFLANTIARKPAPLAKAPAHKRANKRSGSRGA